jgi:hypothetical protein
MTNMGIMPPQREESKSNYGKYSLDPEDLDLEMTEVSDTIPYQNYVIGGVAIILLYFMYKNFQTLRKKLFSVNSKTGDGD